MELPITTLILAVFVSWILAELRGGRAARFFTGAVAIFAAYFVGQFVAGVIPRYESTITRASMIQLGELLRSGQTDRVRSAVATYNTTAGQGSTYIAAQKMWNILSLKPEEVRP